MGEVYLAEHSVTGQRTALKCISPWLMQDPNVRKRFIEEARVMAAIDYPGIVRLLTFFEEMGRFFLVMEYVEGTSLQERMRTSPLSLPEALAIASGVLDSLHHAHTRPQPVVHRDIKPANILLRPDGRPVLADFGIAKAAGRERLTRTRGIVGTYEYMSPEQIKGDAVSAATDIYSLGITLYEMLAGRVPFPQKTDSGLDCMNAHVGREVPPLENHRSDVPRVVLDAIYRSLEKEPQRRFSSAADMKGALAAESNSEREAARACPPSAMRLPPSSLGTDRHQPSPAERQRGSTSRWPWLVAIAALVAATAAGLSALWLGSGDRHQKVAAVRKMDVPARPSEATAAPSCKPECSGRQCGQDGCGAVCGTCEAGTECDASGKCSCAPQCGEKDCGEDGCGGTCGSCATGTLCSEGRCEQDPKWAAVRANLDRFSVEARALDSAVQDLLATCLSKVICRRQELDLTRLEKCRNEVDGHAERASTNQQTGALDATESELRSGSRVLHDCRALCDSLSREVAKGNPRRFGLFRHQADPTVECPAWPRSEFEGMTNGQVERAAEDAAGRKDHDAAYRAWLELAARSPGNARFWNEAGDRCTYREQYIEGLACMKKAQDLGRGEHWFFWGNIADAYYHLGMKSQAIDSYRTYLQMMGADRRSKHATRVEQVEDRLWEMGG